MTCRIFLLSVLAIMAASLTGCQTETIARGVSRPMPGVPHEAPPVPEGALVNRMVFMVGSKPIDTDGNGYPDRIDTNVTFFSIPHPSPLWEDGRVVFSMYIKGEAYLEDAIPIVEWSYEDDALLQSRSVSQVGRQYRMALNLYKTGTDRLPFGEVDLVCRFEPADGRDPIVCNGVRTLQIGRRSSI